MGGVGGGGDQGQLHNHAMVASMTTRIELLDQGRACSRIVKQSIWTDCFSGLWAIGYTQYSCLLEAGLLAVDAESWAFCMYRVSHACKSAENAALR